MVSDGCLSFPFEILVLPTYLVTVTCIFLPTYNDDTYIRRSPTANQRLVLDGTDTIKSWHLINDVVVKVFVFFAIHEQQVGLMDKMESIR